MSKPVFKILDEKGRILIPQELRTALGIGKGDIVGITAERGKLAVKKAVVVEDEWGCPARAQRSGSRGERRSSGMSELSCLHGSERYEACDDVPMAAKECYVQSVVREFDSKALVELLELVAQLIQDHAGR